MCTSPPLVRSRYLYREGFILHIIILYSFTRRAAGMVYRAETISSLNIYPLLCIHSDIKRRATANGEGALRIHSVYLTHVIGLWAKEKPRGEISSYIYYLTRFLHPSSGLHKNTFIIRPICRRERKNNSYAKPHSSFIII